jgi:hypothetical protein
MRASLGGVLAVAVLAMCGAVEAQADSELQDVPPPPPAAEPEPAAVLACTPACRQGYVCQQGQCVSACNPPCAAGERCVDGDCAASAATLAPSYSDAGDDEAPPDLAGGYAPPADTGVEAHDGFMLRLALGVGSGSASEEMAGTELTMSGVAGSFSIDIGGSVAQNLVLHARLGDFVVIDPTVAIDGEELGTAEDTSLAFLLFTSCRQTSTSPWPAGWPGVAPTCKAERSLPTRGSD